VVDRCPQRIRGWRSVHEIRGWRYVHDQVVVVRVPSLFVVHARCVAVYEVNDTSLSATFASRCGDAPPH
jgi:hypothetical protein